jgi:hypothetical protein
MTTALGATTPRGSAASSSPMTQQTPPTWRAPATKRFHLIWGLDRAWPRGQAPVPPHRRGGRHQCTAGPSTRARSQAGRRVPHGAVACASIAGEASARGERARELGRQARDRINVDFNVDNADTPPRASQKLIVAATLLRAMPAPSTPEARNLHREAQALIEQAAVQQAESSASRIHQQGSARDDGGCARPRALGTRRRRG